MNRLLSIALALLVTTAVTAEPPQPAKLALDIDTIMRGPGLVGYPPRAVRWAPDGRHAYFEWKQWSDRQETDFDTYVVGRDGLGLRKLSEDEAKDAPPSPAREPVYTRDRMRAVYAEQGDVFLYDGAANRRRNLTSTTTAESHPRFTHDEHHVTFVRDSNLFLLSLDDGSLIQLTNIAGPDDKGPNVELWEEKKLTASQELAKAEERKLLGVIDRRATKREEDEAKKKREHPLHPLKLEKRESIDDLQLSGDGMHVIARVDVEPEKAKKSIVPTYVTESAYTEELKSREKVGDLVTITKIACISIADGAVKWLETGLKPLPPKNPKEPDAKAPADRRSASDAKAEHPGPDEAAKKSEHADEPKERAVRFGSLVWSEDGSRVVVPVRSRDAKDWWLLALDPATGKTRILATEHDDAWIRDPEDLPGSVGFLPDDETVWYLSEQTGWMQLYAVPHAGGLAHALTTGKFEIDGVVLDPDRKTFDLTTSEVSPYERHLYRMSITGGARTDVTTTAGAHAAVVSPDGNAIADVYSYTNKPPELFITAANASTPIRVTTSPAPEFSIYPWLDAPIVTIKARDGAEVPAHLYKPAGWKPNGPAVIFVHGAGYLQNVTRSWSYYFREYMFHHFLMEHGYVVLDLDYRASAGHGRDWRTAIYRHMGGVDLDDHVDAAKWLATEQGVDPKRIGIYGGSYGGFITLMAMFTSPHAFAAGAALRPVTDWAHYNDGYTSEILNLPQDDPEAYRRSSPIYFADGFEGSLLICHGVVDTNVHFQDTVRLTQRLIELRKENWSVAFYPVENHGFVEPTSWADEYKRIFALFETTIGKARK